MKTWYNSHLSPILLIRGAGGIGKTTLAEEFSNYLISGEKKKIFFIDDYAISEFFLRSADDFGDGFNIYDAYRAMIARSDMNSNSEVLSSERFFLNFDNGNFLIIVDGLDQVIARLGNRFKVAEFLSSIYSADASQRRKVIITCRSAFLPETYFTPQIMAIDVLPFDRKQAEFFLSNRFPSLPKIVERGLSLASSLTKAGETNHFYPFLLDIVANLIQGQLQGDKLTDEEDTYALHAFSSSVLSVKNENDYIIYRVCAREQKKYPHGLNSDQQAECLLALAVKHRGAVDLKGLRDFVEHAIQSTVDEGQLKALVAHPLLVAESSLMFRYDVVRQHFRNVFVGYLFQKQIPVTSECISLLAERNKFAPEFLRECVERIALAR